MQTMEEQVAVRMGECCDLRTEIRELRADIKSLHRTMLCGFFALGGLVLLLDGLMLAFAGLQLA